MRRIPLLLAAAPLLVAAVAACSSSKEVSTVTNASVATTAASASTQTAATSDTTAATADDPKAKEMANKAGAAMRDADQVRLKGTLTEEGATTELDLAWKGKDSTGYITLKGDKVEIITVDQITYITAPDSFWTSNGMPEEALALFSGKWIRVTAADSNAFVSFASITQRDQFVASFLTPTGTLSVGEGKTVHGVDCDAIASSAGGVLYVAKDDGRPIQLAGETSDASGTVDFTYDDVPTPTAPPASDVVDSNSLDA